MFWRRNKASPGFEEKQERRVDASVKTIIGGLAVSVSVWGADLLTPPQGENTDMYMYGAILAGDAVAAAGLLGLAATGIAARRHRSREHRREQHDWKILEEAQLAVDLAYANWREDRVAYTVTPPDQE